MQLRISWGRPCVKFAFLCMIPLWTHQLKAIRLVGFHLKTCVLHLGKPMLKMRCSYRRLLRHLLLWIHHQPGATVSDVDPMSVKAMCISSDFHGSDAAIKMADSPAPLQCRWTEEFLQAMNALQVAQEDVPQFPPAQDIPLADLPTWVQELWPMWQQSARPGPGVANVET